MVRRSCAALLLALTAVPLTGCGGSAGGSARMITLGGDRVTVTALVDAEAGLCAAAVSAASDPTAARAAFFDRAHDALHTVARALQDVDRAQAAELLQAKEKAESGLATRPPALSADLTRLAEVYRSGLGRLAISAPPCGK